MLPDDLRPHTQRMIAALATEIPVMWDDDETYSAALQPAAIGSLLVNHLHQHLGAANFGYVFKKKMAHLDKTTLARAMKAGAKLGYFSGLDLIIEVNWEAWLLLSTAQRIALMDHELCHFSMEVDDKGKTVYGLLGHDVEEFGGIVSRWGLWKPDLKTFATTVFNRHQRDLFEIPALPEGVTASVTFGGETIPLHQ